MFTPISLVISFLYIERSSFYMNKVGILTFSDGRPFVAQELDDLNHRSQNRLQHRLEEDGYCVVGGEEIICTNEQSVSESKRLAAAGCVCTLFSFSVCVFPHPPSFPSPSSPS